MTNLLVLNSSASGDASVSNQLVEAAVEQIVSARPGAKVVRRDLDRDPLPHLTARTVAGVRAQASTAAETDARALSDALIAELKAADVIVIGAPMCQFQPADHPARLVRPRAARRRDLQLFRSRPQGHWSPARRSS